ncbi:unnamed protein product [Vitrella brassicaformis CCMP3155]|uniref:Uncharacterized protein n=1 Tax=Vitrella brassicaformis (strain CCMP3155) TaxID=1169540 RepID=A0A0G4GNJ8_VITBC|nr:unnamed protein product [Vitrella brassicaformis CCMP3155]|eukprot:CEM31872.1 unnamed protein product [Vitrella brassicaformis CCMP3155]
MATARLGGSQVDNAYRAFVQNGSEFGVEVVDQAYLLTHPGQCMGLVCALFGKRRINGTIPGQQNFTDDQLDSILAYLEAHWPPDPDGDRISQAIEVCHQERLRRPLGRLRLSDDVRETEVIMGY